VGHIHREKSISASQTQFPPRKARQKKKDHQHNMAVEFLALQEENKQLRTQINAILGLSYSTPQIKHLSTPY
jgi:hypothetical protein